MYSHKDYVDNDKSKNNPNIYINFFTFFFIIELFLFCMFKLKINYFNKIHFFLNIS